MDIIKWLLQDSDPSLIFQVQRDLLQKPESITQKIRMEISENGYAKALLANRKENGHWGNGVYNPKWTCTHYVLYELVQLGIDTLHQSCKESSFLLLQNPSGTDGGINYAKTIHYSDVCINGMILNIVCYFKLNHSHISEIIDYLLRVQMQDGGWNCEYIHHAKHSSLHTTISVLEGISRFMENGYPYKINELKTAMNKGIEFILRHELYKTETTGEIIKDDFFRYTFPIRWKYDIMRCMDYFQCAKVPFDIRMTDALDIIERSKNNNGKWKAYSQAGKTYFDMEKNGIESKWNTLRAFRILKYYRNIDFTS